jgi:L-alanine-DL-glutamate epimerase-like enolase superfamily enzyme
MPKPIRITRAEAIGLRIPYHPRVRENMLSCYAHENADRPAYTPWLVKLETDAGLKGIGESNTDPRGAIERAQGRPLWELLHSPANNGLMMAAYDVAAQAAGVPVARLFSPTPRRTIQQIWWSHSFRPQLLASETRLGLELGYMVHKIKARPYEDPVEQMAAVAAVAPHDYSVFFDANGSFGSHGRTLAVARGLEKFRQVKGLEQPIAHEDVVGYREIRKALPFRLAVHWEAVDTRTFLLESLVDAFVIEDWRWGPGLMEKAEVAGLTGQMLWVENGLFTGVSQVFQAHMAAALPRVEYTISLTHIAEDDIVMDPFAVKKGGIYEVPRKPGLGVTLDEKAVEKYRIA